MDREAYLIKIVDEFEQWYQNDEHSTNIKYYDEIVTKDHLNSLNDLDFIDFFFEFVIEGGKVQSGGHRKKYDFWATIKVRFDSFKSFVLEPFDREFNLKDWFQRRNNFYGFGVGIATIFLNRIDRYKYPIMNQKTIDALNKLGFKLSTAKSFANYELVKKIQNELIRKFPNLNNYYKTDALNHFLIAIYQGKELISDFQQIETFENIIEQSEIEQKLKNDFRYLDKYELLRRIKDCENEKSEIIIIKGKSYKRHNYLMAQIKRYRDFKCQFCSTSIPKENGEFYIEACHIKAKAKGGKDSLENVLVLCPNCHKLFDFGKRENENFTSDHYSVALNGKIYEATLK